MSNIKIGGTYQHIFTGEKCIVLSVNEHLQPFNEGSEPEIKRTIDYSNEKPKQGKIEFTKPEYVFQTVYKFIGFVGYEV